MERLFIYFKPFLNFTDEDPGKYQANDFQLNGLLPDTFFELDRSELAELGMDMSAKIFILFAETDIVGFDLIE